MKFDATADFTPLPPKTDAATQRRQVLEHLQRAPLTPLEALRRYGIMRLGARVYDLKQEGYDIRTEMIAVSKADGSEARVAQYSMVRMSGPSV
jgi:hypothetical protein